MSIRIKEVLAALAAAFAFVPLAQAADPALPYRLPAKMEGHRFFVEPVTTNGKTLRLYTDTGGGLFFTKAAADALGAKYDASKKPGTPLGEVPWPAFGKAWIPAALAGEEKVTFLEAPPGQGLDVGAGMLGAPWFADRCWEFDYVAGTLRLLPDGALPKVDAAHRVTLGFLLADGKRTTHFPRIAAEVDGEKLELLFDTGATSTLTPEALAAVGDGGPADRASSFITRTTFDRWHKAHPEWPVVAAGEVGIKMDLIRVEKLKVGGYEVASVWFAARPDRNFTEYMSKWMDQPVVGALGGSAFGSFRITVDYRSATATFEQPAKRAPSK